MIRDHRWKRHKQTHPLGGSFIFYYQFLLIYVKVWYCLFCHFDPSTSNAHNLAMSSSQTKFDDKIMIYIEFCIRKSILNLGGGALFLGVRPPKTLIFSGSDSERLERGPQCSARRRNFQKPLRTIVVLRWGYIPTGRNDTSSQYPRCPMQKTKKSAVFAQLGVGDDLRGRGTAVFGRRCHFTSGSPSPNAELK